MFTKCPECGGSGDHVVILQTHREVQGHCPSCKGEGYVPAGFDREAIARAIAGVQEGRLLFEHEYKQADAVIAALSGQEGAG